MESGFFGNGIVQSVLGALIAAFIIWLISVFNWKRDEKLILDYLVNSLKDTSFKFRTTHAISSAINMSEERIRKICSKNNKKSKRKRIMEGS